MKNEPVVPFGWFWFESEENKSPYTQITGYTYERFSTMKPDGSAKIDEGSLIPLYTHPVELTDEKIDECSCFVNVELSQRYGSIESIDDIDWTITGLRAFARAILRKAQEK